MDRQTIAARLPAELRDEYIALVKMLESDGWARFSKRILLELGNARDRKEYAASWEANRVAHGQVSAYQAVLEQTINIDEEFEAIVDELESDEDER